MSDFVEQKKSYRSDNLSAQRVIIRNRNTLLQNKRIGFDRVSGVFRNAFLSTGFEYRDKERNR